MAQKEIPPGSDQLPLILMGSILGSTEHFKSKVHMNDTKSIYAVQSV